MPSYPNRSEMAVDPDEPTCYKENCRFRKNSVGPMAADIPPRPREPTNAPAAEGTSPGSAVLGRDRPPIPDYELQRCIGHGSYGEVWLARNVFGAYRAVKIVYRRAFTDDRPFHLEFEGIKRFEPISRSHPSQLAILHAGKNDEAGYFYYVMELADDAAEPQVSSSKFEVSSSDAQAASQFETGNLKPGTYVPRTLRSELDRHGRLPFAQCIEIGLSLTTALAHLHKHGLVHRDVKPSNIIFVNGIPKLADIGLVTDVGDAKSIVGTEGYLAPEGPGSPPADIFSLGKVLYEIGMGRDRRQFPDLPLDWQDNPDRVRLLELNEVLLKACAQDARQRYQAAQEMNADLALLQSGHSIQRLRTAERRLHFAKRAGLVGAALLLLVTSGFFYQQSQTRRVEREKKIAERERQITEQLLYAADVNLAQQALEAGNLVRATTILQAYLPGSKSGIRNPKSETEQDLRGFEWYYLKNLCRGDEAHTFRGHTQAVRCVAISPDGKLLASGSDDQTIQLWDLASKTNVATLKGHTAAVNAVAFSPDGTRLASGSSDRTVKLWDVAARAVLTSLTNHAEAVSCVVFTPDGQRLVVGTDGASVKLWDTNTGQQLHEFSVVMEFASLALSPNGQYLAIGCDDFRVRLWDLSTFQPSEELYEEAGTIWSLAFSPDGRMLATTRSDGVFLWDLAQRRVVARLKGHEAEVHSVKFSPDGKTLAS